MTTAPNGGSSHCMDIMVGKKDNMRCDIIISSPLFLGLCMVLQLPLGPRVESPSLEAMHDFPFPPQALLLHQLKFQTEQESRTLELGNGRKEWTFSFEPRRKIAKVPEKSENGRSW